MVKNNLIVKSNYIVEASYKLSVGEQRVIYVLTSMINKDDADFKLYKFTAKEFANIIGTKSKNIYSQVSQYVEALRDRDLTIIKEKSILKTKWLSSAEYFVDEGYVELEFSPKLKPYLLLLKKRFTKLSLEQMVRFNSQYSGRIYELLKQYQIIGLRIFRIEDLKSLLGIEIGEYKLYGDFKRKILVKAQKEINHDSELFIDFEEIKKGRKVESIKFIIKTNLKAISEVCASKEGKYINEEEKYHTELINMVKSMFKESITGKEAKFILNTAKSDINIIKEKYDIVSKMKKVDSVVATMIDAIRKDYQAPKGKENGGSFNDYEQRSYDFDDLERKLLGWDKEEMNKETGEEFQQLAMK
ncbi:replication initiation protein [Clostridium estertheticum]|uniref:replication initiation protein n=1 Tax=Clostridium estertheticum TaxID=238834 RepID=UPI001CF14040|nr:replication initiation protein [Clostridium estertheticum]MCB2357154.1 replication initiation protein [Clostridium estertheticum]WAG44055.1 replication initiation protein [Clostridium estertheticum]